MHSPLTGAKKKIASAACMLGIVALCLGVVGYQNKLKADENLPVMTRGVVDKINQIPESKRDMYDADKSTYALGTKENPFLILEIVPYEEYGSFGYNIAGCEPTDIEKMRGTGWMGTISSMNMSDCEQQNPTYFFADEPELTNTKFDDEPKIDAGDTIAHEGYYELVGEGNGSFRQKEDGTVEKSEGGNLIWHTIGSIEKEKDYPSQTFQEENAPKQILTQVGERIYTYRKSSSSDPVYKTSVYYYYKNTENFLKQALRLSDKEAADYSVIIKTITPKELNAEGSNWENYADLYIVSPTVADDNFKTMWKKYNRYGHRSETTNYISSFENVNGATDRDISWKVVENMYRKVTAKTNYAGMMMTANTYGASLTDATKKSIKMDVLDWNLNKNGSKYDTIGYNNNMYKLAIMLLSMKSDLFKKLYMDEEHPYIQNGKFVLQEGDAQEYWSLYTFLPVGISAQEAGYNWYKYWTSDDKWDDYQMPGNIEANRRFINEHMYIGGEGGDILRNFTNDNLNLNSTNTKYTDFQDYMTPPGQPDATTAKPADAIRYILDQEGKSRTDKIKGDLEILDIEPCYDSKNGYSLTKNYIYMMVPDLEGKVNITHMTTAEFIGTAQDLNSTYDLIYMGLDDGAYRKQKQNLQDPTDGSWKEEEYTKWNDSSMNGKIYFHTGDVAKSALYDEWEWDYRSNHSVKFLWFDRASATQDKDFPVIRFPGNDITKIKKDELSKYLDAGYPIVAERYLYANNKLRIDQYSNISAFIREEKEAGSSLYRSVDSAAIEKALRCSQAEVEWKELPELYNGKTESESSSTIPDADYLNTDTNGRSLLTFKFAVKDEDPDHKYKYRIYIDQNGDGKFERDEIFYHTKTAVASGVEQQRTIKISKLYVGLIQWKIEVYRTDNQQIRFTKTGCSAAKNRTGSKKQINVLQIMPKDGDYNGKLNLSTDSLFTKYYKNLNDYEISVDTITCSKFMEYFQNGNRFSFDESKDVNIGGDGEQNPSAYPDSIKTQLYDKYNMLIIGFGDCYGGEDLSNENGAVDFIKYFAAKGKSILFAHDLTSMNNVKVQADLRNPYGYSANALLRDLMGMNRYKAVSNQLSAAERNKIIRYQEKQKDEQGNNKYDTVTDANGKSLDEIHGFTYYEIKRLAFDKQKWTKEDWGRDDKWQNNDKWPQGKKPDDWEIIRNWKMPYQYLIKDAKGDAVCNVNWQTTNSGFNNLNDETTLVTKTNEGQITQYPYKIGTWTTNNKNENVFDDSKLEVAKTHGQYYQLNMEDPEVTVWYCLADDGKDCGEGKADVYGVSPNDTANNYYIYSKANIFYSGVGHSKVDSDMEAKLFINTIIGAYRVSYEPPIVEVLNPEAEITDTKNLSYTMTYNQEYDGDTTEILSQKAADTANEGVGSDADSDMVKVWFSPVELNAISTRLRFSIYYTDGNSGEKHYVTTIYHVNEDDKVDTLTTNESRNWVYADEKNAQGDYITDNINSMDEYYFYYPKAYLSENWKDKDGNVHANARRNITFEIKNNKIKETGYTKLNMQTQALFLLD